MATEFRTKPQVRNSDHVKYFYPIFTTTIGVHGLSGCDYHQQMHKLKKTSLRPPPAPLRNGMDSKRSRILAMDDLWTTSFLSSMNSVPAACEHCEAASAKLGFTLPCYRTYQNGLFPSAVINGPLFSVIDCRWSTRCMVGRISRPVRRSFRYL